MNEIRSSRDLYKSEALDLIDSIKEDRSTRAPMKEGAKSLSLVLSARNAAEQNKEVQVETI